MNFPNGNFSSGQSHGEALRGLYVLTDEKMGGGHLSIAQAALRGGAKIIQLRDKSTPPRQLLPIAREIRRLTREFGALFLVNDALDLALLCEADGVHLGPDDFSISDARALLGAQKIIGQSCGTPDEARQAQKLGANYIGIGAVFGTQTKSDAGDAIGLEGLQNVRAATSLPCAAIGGISTANFASVAQTGVEMVCVISAVALAGDDVKMEGAARKLAENFEGSFFR